MYCPNCGVDCGYGLKYCKHCGKGLAEGTQVMAPVPPAPPPRIGAAAWPLALATTGIVLGGLGIIFTNAFELMRPMAPGLSRSGDATPVAVVMIVFGSALIFAVVALLIRLFGHLIAPRHQQPAQTPRELTGAPPLVQLPAPPSAVGSVTEHTTRNFEPRAYSEFGARE